MKNHHSLGDPAGLAALYAGGAMGHEERAEFEAHLAGCEACRAELQQLHHVLAALAAAVEPVTPDPRTREALLRRIAAQASSPGTPSPLGEELQAGAPPGDPGAGLVIQRAAEGCWEKTAVEGVSIRRLFVDRPNNHFTALVRMAPGTSYPGHVHNGPEECLVLEGDLRVGEDVLWPGDYQRAPVGSRHGVQSTEQGCLLLITSSLTDEFV
jgi:anti-sigma factor ChrR (cupin superfamily)